MSTPSSVHRAPHEAGTTLAWLAALGLAVWVLSAADVQVPRLLVLLLLSPVLEEAVFRAGLQEHLLQRWHARPALWANLVTALAFAAAHVIVREDATAWLVAAPALLVGLLYQRHRRVRACAALHAAMNAAWLGWAQFGTLLPGSTTP